ncbi:6-phospho-beta-glucosidase [Vibrio hangzhouensis]|uniref:6-phospho-beta-glucosidase n=1 Tax=Vibrio hangzhouensis TaxID=462991 RepID=A0A1H6BRU1_9VIBR|nr:6-phospho-beta-glucosidase [Vibrio hangzhouensis]SEG63352.1 6-phospho-beta-glucosidase [Vibrio hangzhouensis]
MTAQSLKIAVIGGGSSYTPELIEGILLRQDSLPVREICLTDIEAGKEKLEIITALTQRMVAKAKADIVVSQTLDRRKAIKGADFVMTQFRVGGLKARQRDEAIPLKYNRIGQETTGSGGFAKALRTIPVVLDICRDIEELAPNAWMLNFTNPAGLVTEAIQKYSNVKTIGLCNVPVSMQMMASEMLDCEPSALQMKYAGLNHLVWVTSAYLNGREVTKELLEKVGDGANFSMKNIFEEPWDADFLNALGVIPCPYHRYYYQTEAMLAEEQLSFKEKGSRATQVMTTEAALFELYKQASLDSKPKELEERGGAYYSDASLNLVDAIHNNRNDIHVVNVRNAGVIRALPDDAVIECSAVIGNNGATPLAVDPLPHFVESLISRVKSYEMLTVEAAVYGDKEKALLALATHPLVGDIQVAKSLLDDILEQNEDHLPQFVSH